MHASFSAALKIVAISILLSCVATEDDKMAKTDTYIAVVKQGVDVHAVAKDIQRRSDSDHHSWVGTVEKAHPHIGILIVNGPEGTCFELSAVKGIKKCEKDSVISVHD